MPKPIEDLTGKKYGKLTVLHLAEKSKSGKTRWTCKCACENGTILDVFATNLKSGSSTSCGCQKKGFRELKEKPELQKKLHRGCRYGHFLLWGHVGRGRYAVTCNCPQGRPSAFLFVKGDDLLSGRRTSCNAEDRERSKLRRSHPREFASYAAMIRRTRDPHDKNYGGRGINVEEAWLPEKGGFKAFLDYTLMSLGPCPEDCTLDRWPNVNGNYEPGNIMWGSDAEQARHKRTSRFVEFDGSRMNIVDFSRMIGWHHSRVARWLDKGKTPEEIAMEAAYEIVTI
jgi:hypothetical protein